MKPFLVIDQVYPIFNILSRRFCDFGDTIKIVHILKIIKSIYAKALFTKTIWASIYYDNI